TPEEIAAIGEFVKALHNVEEWHLLPYHRLGQDKYDGLGREYTLKDITPPTDEHMQKLLGVAKKYVIKAQIGG
ncbi:MAG: glycyl-radical enzyme activating protein, partial [Clostridia bacterium]|nr:glycyl-radical enzyme activating protein [Clostridia bacterium]